MVNRFTPMIGEVVKQSIDDLNRVTKIIQSLRFIAPSCEKSRINNASQQLEDLQANYTELSTYCKFVQVQHTSVVNALTDNVCKLAGDCPPYEQAD